MSAELPHVSSGAIEEPAPEEEEEDGTSVVDEGHEEVFVDAVPDSGRSNDGSFVLTTGIAMGSGRNPKPAPNMLGWRWLDNSRWPQKRKGNGRHVSRQLSTKKKTQAQTDTVFHCVHEKD